MDVPERVCPLCSTIARTADSHCPYCANPYRRVPRGGVGPLTLVALLLVHAALVLGGFLVIVLEFGDTLEQELDRQVSVVQRDIEEDLDGVVRDLKREVTEQLDARLPERP